MAHPSNRRQASLNNETTTQHDVKVDTVRLNATSSMSVPHNRSDEIPTRRPRNTKHARHTPHLLKHSKRLSKHSHQTSQVLPSRLTRRQDAGFGNATITGTNSTIGTGILIGSGTSESAVTTATLTTSSPVVQVTITVVPLPVNSTSSIDASQNTSSSVFPTSSFPPITSDQLVAATTTTTLNATLPTSASVPLSTISTSTTTNATDIITTTYGAQTTLQTLPSGVIPVTIVQPIFSTTTLNSSLTASTIVDTNATSITALPISVSTAVPTLSTTSSLPDQLSTMTNGTVITLTSAASSGATITTGQQAPTSASWVVVNGTTVLATDTNSASATPSLLSEAPLAGSFLSTSLVPEAASTWTTINGSALWVATTPTSSPVPVPYAVIFGGPISTQAVFSTANSLSSTVSIAASSIPQAILSTAVGSSSIGTVTASSVSPTGLNTVYVIPVAASDHGSSSVVYETASTLSGAVAPISSLPAGSSGSFPTSRANIVTYSGIVTLGPSSTAVPIVIPVGSSGSGSSTTIYALLPFSSVANWTPSLAVSAPSGAGLASRLTTISTIVSGTPTTFITQIGSVAEMSSSGAATATSASSAFPTSTTGSGNPASTTATLFPVASAASSLRPTTGTISTSSSAADSITRGSSVTTDSSATRVGSSAVVFTSSGVVYTSSASGIIGNTISASAPTSTSTLTPISNRVNDTAPAGTIAGGVVGGLAGISIILLLALLGLRFLKRRTETSAALAGTGAAGTGAAAMIPARGAPVTPPMAERGFQRLGGRKLPSRFSPGIEGPTTRFSGTPTPAPSSFYPSGAPSGSSFGTFGSPLLGATAGAGAGFAAASTIPEEPEDPFADPIWNDDSPVRPGQVNSPLLGSQMGSPQRPGTRGSAMSRFTEDVL